MYSTPKVCKFHHTATVKDQHIESYKEGREGGRKGKREGGEGKGGKERREGRREVRREGGGGVMSWQLRYQKSGRKQVFPKLQFCEDSVTPHSHTHNPYTHI